MIITIQNFISHEEVAFWRHYVKFATINPSSEVTLKKVAVYTDGTEEETIIDDKGEVWHPVRVRKGL